MSKRLIFWISLILALAAFARVANAKGIATNPSPPDGAVSVESEQLTWTPGCFAAWHDVYLGTDFNDVNDAADPNVSPGIGRREPNNAFGLIGLARTYYWRVDEVNDTHGNSPCKGDVWSFSTLDGKAHNPSPADEAKDVPCDANLAWERADYAVGHRVFFGTSWDSVNSMTEPCAVQDIGDEEYDLPLLQFSTAYYWRIDEVYDPNDPNAFIRGDVWRFTVADFIVIDNFESYNETDNWIHDTWVDVMGQPWGEMTGSWIELGQKSQSEPVHAGEQSMRYEYYTDAWWADLDYAEAWLPFGQPQDWAGAGAKILTLWFSGHPDNDANGTEQMYVGLEDSDGVYAEFRYGDNAEDMNDIKTRRWRSWNIALANFNDPNWAAVPNDVNLAAISKLYIGFGNRRNPVAAGSGVVYFDDIQLHIDCGPPLEPSPPDNATNVAVDVTLSWQAGKRATSHDVYFGTDFYDVNHATTVSPQFKSTQTETTYDPCGLSPNATYYWRIDQACQGKIIDKGEVWGFTTFGGNISRAEAYEIILPIIDEPNDVRVYGSKYTIGANTIIKTFRTSIESPPFESWYFFIDDHPWANWEHPCRHVFANTGTAQYEVFTGCSPPTNFNDYAEMGEESTEGEYSSPGWILLSETSACESADRNYAVIIYGGGNEDAKKARYWNSCSFIYETLVNVYGYREDHIYVLMTDGTTDPSDLDDNGTADVDYAATRAYLTTVFDELAAELDVQDSLFIFTTNHGGHLGFDQRACLFLWGENEYITDQEFAAEVDKVKAGQIAIVMGQCYGGGFIDDLSRSSRVIATSCDHDETSGSYESSEYCEFLYHWTVAMAGEDPDGNPVDADADNDGFVSMKEAYDYAWTNDEIRIDGYYEPQYDSQPEDFGDERTLYGVTGPDLMMQNTILDIGLEPDHTIAEAEYFMPIILLSPDIVVRHAPDDGTIHQNPEYGSINYVYVRARNRGCEPVSGTIRVYYADWATGENWPAHWTEIGTTGIDVTDLASRDVMYDYLEWSPPATGSYSLLARFESDEDPMAYAETTRVGDNVVNNNNIVVRSALVVDEVSGGRSYSITVRNIYPEPAPINFLLLAPESEQADNFLDYGDVLVDLGQELFDLWTANGQQGTGFEIVGPNTLRMLSADSTVIAEIPLDANEEFIISMRFDIPEEQPCRHADEYLVHLFQFVTCDEYCTENCTVAGDLNQDCVVDFNDLKIVADNWLTTSEELIGDVYPDWQHTVNLRDLAALTENWSRVAIDVTGGVTYEIRMNEMWQ